MPVDDTPDIMVEHTTPYQYGDERGDGGLDAEPESDHGTETVIVDGSAMSYRSYQRHDEEADGGG